MSGAGTTAAPAVKPKATRQAFGETLLELGATHPRIVALDADLSKSTKTELFAKKYPDRFFEMGIAEANMIGTASGLALAGFVPFACSFGCFLTGRYDTIRISTAYTRANVRLVGTHAGVGIGDDGHSQMGLEDLALMRELPGMLVLQPCDEIETKQMVRFLADYTGGPAYLRLTRQNLAPVHGEGYRFGLGKLDVLRRGSSGGAGGGVALVGSGAGVQECLGAAEKLKARGVDATVVNAPSIKPIDAGAIRKLAAEHRHVVTVEDHYVNGGLGSAVAEALAEGGVGARLTRLGIQDVFGESGEPAELYEKFGISAAKIAETVLRVGSV